MRLRLVLVSWLVVLVPFPAVAYPFAVDEVRLVVDGAVVFHDDFGGGTPPGPGGIPANWSRTLPAGGQVEVGPVRYEPESGGKLQLHYDDGAVFGFYALGSPGSVFVPEGRTHGLTAHTSIPVGSDFELTVVLDLAGLGESDSFQLGIGGFSYIRVGYAGAAGQPFVQVGPSVQALVPFAGTWTPDQIRLRLSHSGASGGVLIGSYDLMANGISTPTVLVASNPPLASLWPSGRPMPVALRARFVPEPSILVTLVAAAGLGRARRKSRRRGPR